MTDLLSKFMVSATAEPHWHSGVHIETKFRNGWGTSVIQTPHSYGNRNNEGFWEVAIVNAEGELDYTTPITDDVLGWLDEAEVRRVHWKVALLPPKDTHRWRLLLAIVKWWKKVRDV